MRSLLLLALSACVFPGNSEPDRYTVDDYWAELADAHCGTMLDCCTQAEYNDWWTTSDGEVIDCEASHRAPPSAGFIRDGIRNGNIVFDEARAQSCVATLTAQACPAFEQAIRFRETYCESPFIGRLADGEDCSASEECTGGRCFDFKCSTLLPEDAPCTVGGVDACEAPFRCTDMGDSDFRCQIGRPGGASCVSDDQCANGWCKDSVCRDACNGQ